MSDIAGLAARTWLALVHHPVYDRNRRIVTTAITNLDIHDIARSSRTFGLAGYHLVTPVAAQRELAARILGHWESSDGQNDFRRDALAKVGLHATIDDAVAAIAAIAQAPPLLVATSARPVGARPPLAPQQLLDLLAATPRPLLLLFGTGWGLADEVADRVDHVLSPIRGCTDYNHLSVRSAAAIMLDRLFGLRT